MVRASEPIRLDVNSLIGGVSQQPHNIRLESQAEVQDNAYANIVDGLGKRQPAEHIRRLTEITDLTENKSLVHWINRDSTERYAVIIDHDFQTTSTTPGLKVFDLTTGLEIPVTGKDGATLDPLANVYLGFAAFPFSDPNAKRDLKVLTIADTTFILNKGFIVRKDTSIVHDAYNSNTVPSPIYESKSARRWFCFQRVANALSKYAVRLHLKTGGSHATPDTWDPPLATDKEKADATAWVKTFGLDYTIHPGAPWPDPLQHMTGYGNDDDVPPYAPLITGLGEHEGYMIPTVQTHEVADLLFAQDKEGILGSAASYYPGGIAVNYAARKVTAEDLDLLILQQSGLGGPFLAPQKGPVIKIELQQLLRQFQVYRSDIVVAREGHGDEDLIVFSDEIDRLSQLPLICEHGHIVKITGLDDNDADEFYAEFESTDVGKLNTGTFDSNMTSGFWKEGMASLSLPHIDEVTMPLRLVRVPVGGSFRFELYHEEWDDKLVGDDVSNPDPKFIDETIEDIFFWRNRLGFLTKSRFIMSEADEHLNFWRTTVKVLLDSDPIDVDAGHGDVADLRFATALEGELVVWSDRTQFLNAGEPILSPKTSGLEPITEYESYPDLKPEVVEDGIFFGLKSGGGAFSRIMQFHRRQETASSFGARRSSEQVPRYINGKIVEMTASPLESVLLLRTDDSNSKHILWVYKWHDEGVNRILSSWMRFLVGPSFSTIVHGIKFIDDDLYMIVERNSGSITKTICMEKIVFSGHRQVDNIGGTDSSYRCNLDRRVDETDCTFAYNSTDKTLDITLPYHVAEVSSGVQEEMKIVSRVGTSTGPEGEQFAHTHASNAATPKASVLKISDEDQVLFDAYTAGTFDFFIGQTYTMEYEFSRPSLRSKRPDLPVADIPTGRLQILRCRLVFEDSGFFKLTVSPALNAAGTEIVDRDTKDYTLPMLEVGLGRSHAGVVNIRDGVFKAPIYAQPEHFRLVLTNDSPYPSNLKSLHYQANYSRRSRLSAF